MTVAGFSKIKETRYETFSISPVVQDGLTPLTSFSPNQIRLLFQLHLHNFQQGFPNKQRLSYFYALAFHPSLSPAAPSSIKACPVLSSGIETGTGRWFGATGSKDMSEERHRVTVCQGFVCGRVIDGGDDKGETEAKKTEECRHERHESPNFVFIASVDI